MEYSSEDIEFIMALKKTIIPRIIEEEKRPSEMIFSVPPYQIPMHKSGTGARLWSAMSNMTWTHASGKLTFNCSFRVAGGIISSLIQQGEYMDWYCCMTDGIASPDIVETMYEEGWTPDNSKTTNAIYKNLLKGYELQDEMIVGKCICGNDCSMNLMSKSQTLNIYIPRCTICERFDSKIEKLTKEAIDVISIQQILCY